MSDEEWTYAHARCLAVYLSGSGLQEVDNRGRPVRDDDFLMLFNAHDEEVAFVLPLLGGAPWRCVLDTSQSRAASRDVEGATYALRGRSLALLTRTASMP
jgi:glycogen operon protein